MGKVIDFFFKKDKPQLEDGFSLALREIAGWPLESHLRQGHRSRHHNVTIHRDSMGRVIGSVETFDEDEYDQYSDQWGK